MENMVSNWGIRYGIALDIMHVTRRAHGSIEYINKGNSPEPLRQNHQSGSGSTGIGLPVSGGRIATRERWIYESSRCACLSRFPLALSPKTKRTRSCTSCGGTHVTSGVNTRQTPSNLTGIRTMEITAWQLDALSSCDRRSSGRRGLSRRSGRVDISWTYIRDADS
jgi:hypothetical protein